MDIYKIQNQSVLIEAKESVKRTHAKLKLTDKTVKIGHVYEKYAKQRGFQSWNECSAHLKKLDEDANVCTMCGNTKLIGNNKKKPCPVCYELKY